MLYMINHGAVSYGANTILTNINFEINAGQMVEDVRLAANGAVPVEHFGRRGGIVPDPEEIVVSLKENIKSGRFNG